MTSAVAGAGLVASRMSLGIRNRHPALATRSSSGHGFRAAVIPEPRTNTTARIRPTKTSPAPHSINRRISVLLVFSWLPSRRTPPRRRVAVPNLPGALFLHEHMCRDAAGIDSPIAGLVFDGVISRHVRG